MPLHMAIVGPENVSIQPMVRNISNMQFSFSIMLRTEKLLKHVKCHSSHAIGRY